MKVSVLICVYSGDLPFELERAILSTGLAQTVRPYEIILIVDGPVSEEMNTTIQSLCERDRTLRVYRLPENVGLANALSIGIEKCSGNYIARMDADDISRSHRLQRLIEKCSSNKNLDIVGSYIEEFDSGAKRWVREVPLSDFEIKKRAWLKSPFNHVSVIMKKEFLLKIGGYRAVGNIEDYDLWLRSISENATLANIPEVLVDVKFDKKTISRRKGINYLRNEVALFTRLYREKKLPFNHYVLLLVLRVPVRLLPSFLFSKLMRNLMRKRSQ